MNVSGLSESDGVVMKLKMQQRPCEAGITGAMEHPVTEAASTQWSQPKSIATCAAHGRPGPGIPRPVESSLQIHPHAEVLGAGTGCCKILSVSESETEKSSLMRGGSVCRNKRAAIASYLTRSSVQAWAMIDAQ